MVTQVRPGNGNEGGPLITPFRAFVHQEQAQREIVGGTTPSPAPVESRIVKAM